jgi:hypothetical protein
MTPLMFRRQTSPGRFRRRAMHHIVVHLFNATIVCLLVEFKPPIEIAFLPVFVLQQR